MLVLALSSLDGLGARKKSYTVMVSFFRPLREFHIGNGIMALINMITGNKKKGVGMGGIWHPSFILKRIFLTVLNTADQN